MKQRDEHFKDWEYAHDKGKEHALRQTRSDLRAKGLDNLGAFDLDSYWSIAFKMNRLGQLTGADIQEALGMASSAST